MLSTTNRACSALALVLTIAWATCGAQTQNEDLIAACAGITAAEDRIRCLENALRNELPEDSLGPDVKTAATADITQPAPEQPQPSAVATDAAATVDEIEDFGLSPAQIDPEPLESISVTVVSVRSDAYGKLIFTTESGHIWRQIDRATPRYRQIPFDAEIRRGAVGSYFMRPLESGVSVRVSRSR